MIRPTLEEILPGPFVGLNVRTLEISQEQDIMEPQQG